MPSRILVPARRAVVSPFLALVLVPLSLGLAACGGGGPAQARPSQVSAEDPFALQALPGEIVLLQPSGATLGSAVDSFSWTQTDGPAVELRDASSAQAHFVMPAVAADTRLGFALTVVRSSGEVVGEARSVACARRPRHGHPPPPASPPQFAVFKAAKDLATRVDLYLARLDGSEVFRLNGPLVPGGFIGAYAISPDRTHVAYLAAEDTANVFELFVARTDGGGITKVSGPLVAGGDVVVFEWAPDGSRLAFLGDVLEDGVHELFTVRPDGSELARASGPVVAGGFVLGAAGGWSPDGSRLAYAAVQYTSGVGELFTSRADGTENVRVSGPQVAGGSMNTFTWSPDGTRIAYTAAERTAGVLELFTVRPDGTDHVVVSGPMATGGGIAFQPAWSPDGSRIAYQADQLVDDRFDLFTSLPDGSGNTLVSALASGDRDVFHFKWSPDGSRIAYSADQDTTGLAELFASGPDGAANVKISAPLGAGGANDAFFFEWSPAGDRVAYRAREATGSPVEIFSARGDGGGATRVSGPMVAGGFAHDFAWSPDGAFIAYRADQLVQDQLELFVASPDGGPTTRVSGTPASDGDVWYFLWSADGARLAYSADQLVDDRIELFVAAPDGGAVNAAISGAMTAGGEVVDFATR